MSCGDVCRAAAKKVRMLTRKARGALLDAIAVLVKVSQITKGGTLTASRGKSTLREIRVILPSRRRRNLVNECI